MEAVHLGQMLLELVLPGERTLASGLAEARLVFMVLLKVQGKKRLEAILFLESNVAELARR